MTELSFLLELLLNHKLPKTAKDLILPRINELAKGNFPRALPPPGPTSQAPSTQAILDRNPDLAQPIAMSSGSVTVVAQTAATQAAMASRATAIGESMAGKVDKVTGRPRKF